MSNITKNGFYKLSEIKEITKDFSINIASDLEVCIFNDMDININVEIGENSKLDFFSFFENSSESKIIFNQNKENSILKVNCLLLSKDNKIKTKIHSKLKADFIKADMNIVSMVLDNGFVDIDGVIEIVEGIKKVEGYLNQENLFLGSSGKIKGIPTLLVASSDIKASHSCKIEKISDEKLFYLRSRGLSKNNALSVMIEAQVKTLFFGLSKVENHFYEELIKKIISKI